MMKEVISRGHRDIVILFYRNLMPLRLQGFHDAMREAGIRDYEKRTFLAERSQFGVSSTLKKIQKSYPAVTAIVCGSDNLLSYLIHTLDKQCISWRNRIGLTGFGNVIKGISTVPFASVDQHLEDVGRLASNCLVDMVEHGIPAVGIREKVDTDLIDIGNIPILRY